LERQARLQAFRLLAADLEKVDLATYEKFGRDPLEPVIGEGDPAARIAIFGRDPGRDEVLHGIPFIGAGGQKVRGVLHQVLYDTPLPDFEASRTVGDHVFWANTVPYKPLGNKAWSIKVKRMFQPLMADLLYREWRGDQILTLGREAFFWFEMTRPDEKAALESHWQRPDRFQTSLEWSLSVPGEPPRQVWLHPLPHPSPLNATWYTRFPDLLAARLRALDWRLDNWRDSR